jgi:hypothetical protein
MWRGDRGGILSLFAWERKRNPPNEAVTLLLPESIILFPLPAIDHVRGVGVVDQAPAILSRREMSQDSTSGRR